MPGATLINIHGPVGEGDASLRTAERIGRAFERDGVVGVDARLQLLGGNLYRGGQGGRVVALLHQSVAVVARDGLVVVVDRLVENHPGEAARLLELGGRHLVARAHLVEKASALAIHQNGPAAAHALGDQRRGFLLDRRMDPGYWSIWMSFGADGLRHHVAVACRPWLVGGHIAFQVGTVFQDQIGVRPQAAARQDDGLGGIRIAIGAFTPHDRPRVIGQKLAYLGTLLDRDAALFDRRLQARHQGGAHRRPRRWDGGSV